jgi:putative transposase
VSRNYYAEINLHMVWHTKQSLPLLTPEIEAFTHRYLRGRLINTPGAYVHEIGGTDNHVHLVVSVAPTITISTLIGELKGASAHEANKQFPQRGKVLHWQTGYGVVSFGPKDLPWVVRYAQRQREHHARGQVYDRLERITSRDDVDGMAEAEPREAP